MFSTYQWLWKQWWHLRWREKESSSPTLKGSRQIVHVMSSLSSWIAASPWFSSMTPVVLLSVIFCISIWTRKSWELKSEIRTQHNLKSNKHRFIPINTGGTYPRNERSGYHCLPPPRSKFNSVDSLLTSSTSNLTSPSPFFLLSLTRFVTDESHEQYPCYRKDFVDDWNKISIIFVLLFLL